MAKTISRESRKFWLESRKNPPVRGKSRITTMTVLSAEMVNVRRIARYLFAPSIH